MNKVKIEELITRVTFRVTLNKKRYLCCCTVCCNKVKISISKEWGFNIRKGTALFMEIARIIADKLVTDWNKKLKLELNNG